MHGAVLADSLTIMGADTPSGMEYQDGMRITVDLTGDGEKELTDFFQKLSDGGSVEVPLNKTQWGDSFGMFTDKYGVEYWGGSCKIDGQILHII